MKLVYTTLFFLLIISAYGYYDLIDSNIVSQENLVYETGMEPIVYFTSTHNMTEIFLALINDSKDIKCAFYDLEDENIINNLKIKNATIFIEEDNFHDIFEISPSRYKMHNKFCVFDNISVITGSLNPTKRGLNGNDNNMILFHSSYLAKNYLDELEEFKTGTYGDGKSVKYPKIMLNGNIEIQNLFCPEDNCQKKVLEELDKAKRSISFMTFSFTDKAIADLLIEKNIAGLDTKGVFEKSRLNMQYEMYKYLNFSNVTLFADTNKYNMHHKIFIIDNDTVITGSYNPTAAGNRGNDENIIIIKDKQISDLYLVEFRRLMDNGERI